MPAELGSSSPSDLNHWSSVIFLGGEPLVCGILEGLLSPIREGWSFAPNGVCEREEVSFSNLTEGELTTFEGSAVTCSVVVK